MNARKAGAKQLVLFHMEDETVVTRRELFLADAQSSNFTGKIVVPLDSDTIEF